MPDPYGGSVSMNFRNTGNDLYFKIETGKPGYSNGRPVRIGCAVKDLLLDRHYDWKLLFGVCVKRRHIDDILQAASRSTQDVLEIFENQLDLTLEIRLRCSIATAPT